MQRTTIAVSPRVRDRLQTYGRKGMTYEGILVSLMDAADPGEHIRSFEPTTHGRTMTEEEITALRKLTPSEKVAMGSRMLRMALRNNPRGYRSLIESRRKIKNPS